LKRPIAGDWALKSARVAAIRAKRIKLVGKGLLSRLYTWSTDTTVIANGRALAEPAVAIDPLAAFQPDPGLITSYTRFDESDASNIVRTKAGVIFHKDIPYSIYEGKLQFHPNRIGRYLVAARPVAKAIRTALRVRQFLTELPNGGLALYYPRTIRTARFLTPEFVYSGISQGQLLAGYTRLIVQDDQKENESVWRETAARLALALLFPVELGGVCADGKIILEAPNFRSCPETILNGWLDALIHLNDYLQVVSDAALREFYHGSLRALTQLLPYFDDPAERLSKYSNLSPYTFRVHLSRPMQTAPALRIEYLSRQCGYRDRWIEDVRGMGPPSGPYDNGIPKIGRNYLDVSLSVVSHYDIRIKLAADCRRVSFDPGASDEISTVPHAILQRRSILPAVSYDGKSTSFFLCAKELHLLAGCSTNFAKHSGENFYHPYHAAALYQLALTSEDEREQKTLIEFADSWLSYIVQPSRPAKRFAFADIEDVIKTIDRSRACPVGYTVEQLRQTLA
jgi:hypothetical protein